MRITVLSTFDVWPPRDGGQTRYVNLWRNFSREHEITIVCYEFRNLSGERRYRIDDHVEVVVPRASRNDARHFEQMMAQTSLWLHDVLCLRDYGFSDEFLTTLRRHVDTSDVVVASHPYLAHVAFPLAKANVTRVYESYNVEYDIKRDYFTIGRDQALLADLLSEVRRAEGRAAAGADHVTAVSEADRLRLVELYDLPADKVSTVPNGANIRSSDLLTPDEKAKLRASLGLDGCPVGIFLGSAYSGNVESYRQARQLLDAAGFRGMVLLVGSIDQASRADWPAVSFQERWLGFVDDHVRDLLLGSAHFALQLMFAGAGTNLKLFDYMGAGVPIVANAFGRRGIQEEGWCWHAETGPDLAAAISNVMERPDETARLTAQARRIALSQFDWRAIAAGFQESILGELGSRSLACTNQSQVGLAVSLSDPQHRERR